MKEDFNFKQFVGVGSKLSNYSISITNSAAFGLNSGFYSGEKLKEFQYVTLFYDSNRKAIAFLFTNDKTEKGTFKISHSTNSGYISARTFFLSLFPGKPDEFKKYLGRYGPQAYDQKDVGKLYYILLEEETKEETKAKMADFDKVKKGTAKTTKHSDRNKQK
jgi:hypothetical protein